MIMTTPAEQYRTLVARLESIQEAGTVSPGVAQSATNAVTSPDASGAVLRAILTTGMSVVPEIVAFLMKKSAPLEYVDKFIARGFLRHQLITGLLGKSRKVAQRAFVG